jgi:hypothetical protein
LDTDFEKIVGGEREGQFALLSYLSKKGGNENDLTAAMNDSDTTKLTSYL